MRADLSVKCAFLCSVLLLSAPGVQAYSVLTHEAIIDSAWDQNIKPLLLKRFPDATPDALLEAHAYAYGGCILQDMGYYPFGSRFFSDLLHYVRSGDFVVTQIAEARELNEYAFALGSLAHYAADNEGHNIAVNPSVAIEYPGLERKYGKVVTYEENPGAHIKVEFGFDVLQVARGNYAPTSYHDFIGFRVSKPVLERAFRDTYGLELTEVFSDLDLALGTYRHTVSTIIPEMTKAAWASKRKELRKASPKIDRRKFVYNLSRASYEREWSAKYEKPGLGARIIAFVIRIIPKIGPLKAVAFKPPTPRTTRMFEDSFDKTLDAYHSLLARAGQGNLRLANTNFDTGAPVRPASYRLADNTYAKLVAMLANRNAADLDPKLRENILEYYRNLDAPFATKEDHKQWQRTLEALDKLKAEPANE